MSDGFDLDTAWYRRFSADAASNLGAFAERAAEALPGLVTIEHRRGLFGRRGEITGVAITLGERIWRLALQGSRLEATIAMVVRGITLNTRQLDPAEWFAELGRETRAASNHAQTLSRALGDFMAR